MLQNENHKRLADNGGGCGRCLCYRIRRDGT